VETAERRRIFVADWVAFLQGGPDVLADRLRGSVNLVAATVDSLATDGNFGDGVATTPVSFDLLVLERAEQVAEAEFFGLARRCRRWILVAESMPQGPVREMGSSRPAVPKSNSRPLLEVRRLKSLGPSFFQRLWEQLHCDPRRLPYVWAREADMRLCCRLRPVSVEQRRWIETERVADFPDIELRIVAPPRSASAAVQDSFLAEVVFPLAMSLQDAKSYIFRELQELPVRAFSPTLRWTEQPERLVLHLTRAELPAEPTARIDLTQGVREVIATHPNGNHPSADGWFTHSLEFDRAAGWERSQAEKWTHCHLGLRDLGRTALLDVPQGIAPGVAQFLSDVLFADGYCLPTLSSPAQAIALVQSAVDFVAVPPLARAPARSQLRRPKFAGGAGFELDLADPRHRDRLPSDVRAALGETRGLVNYLEAQAVVRSLERLVCEPEALRIARRYREDHHPATSGVRDGPLTVIGVVALYPAQAKLIRYLIERNQSAFASCRVEVRVDVPEGFAERECTMALVSLTRSHTHRATSFGEGPAMLTLALTRGRERLMIFADPGTLARRAEWQGPLDHLDDPGSAREGNIISNLVRYLHGHGQHPGLFQIKSESPAVSLPIGSRGASVHGSAAREGSNA
jgi:hypothetical protein